MSFDFSVFWHDKDTGQLFRRFKNGAFKPVGSVSKSGYVQVSAGGRLYLAHRIAWLLATGEWPKGEIDHIDGNKANNRLSNLRDVSVVVNQQNIKAPRRTNVAGALGVGYRQGRKYRARIRVNGSQVSLGAFATKQEAADAYLAAKRVLHEGNTL